MYNEGANGLNHYLVFQQCSSKVFYVENKALSHTHNIQVLYNTLRPYLILAFMSNLEKLALLS